MDLVEVEKVVGEVSEVEEDVEGVEAMFKVVIDAELIEVNGGSFSGFL